MCVNIQTDTDKLNIVVYRHRNNLYLKDNEVDLKVTEYQSLLAKWVYLLSYIDIFYKRCFVLDETTVHNWNKLCQEWMFFSSWAFSDCTRDENCHLNTIVFAENFFLSACFWWDSRLFLREMDQKFKLGGTIGYGDS